MLKIAMWILRRWKINHMSCRPRDNQKTIVLASNYAWTVVNFRLDLILALQKEGFRVHVLTQTDGHENDLKEKGVFVHPLLISGAGINPFQELVCFFSVLRCLMTVRPIAFLGFTIKPVIYGALACRILRVPCILTITGLGTAFISKSWITLVVKFLMRISFTKAVVVFFQNSDDKDFLLKEKVLEANQVQLVPGSGVNLERFEQAPLLPKQNINYLFIGRMIKDKGIVEFVNAAKIVKKLDKNTTFALLGPAGVKNRTAVSIQKIKEWQKNGIIDYLGEASDVRSHLSDATCVVLPSYREGLSRVLLEAGAMGRPAIASNVPGCKDIIEHGLNGLLCEVKNENDLAVQMSKFASMPFETKVAMGNAARRVVESKFDVKVVCGLYINAVKKTVEKY